MLYGGVDMTKEQFFALPKARRVTLIERAHEYYISDFNENLDKVIEPDVREFIAMCIEERNKAAAAEAALFC